MTTAHLVAAPTLELLTWISARPRTYRETIEAWRTCCPRLSVWDDAIGDGLVEVARAGRQDDALVRVTAAGRALLEGGPARTARPR
jgi:hypothetical protein